nr:B3 domain-containing protein REM9-like [Ipomoea batatas]
MDKKFPFFRVMNVAGTQTKLHLPPIISKKLVEQDIKEVLLTSQKGTWEVEIHSFEGKHWFTNGWEDFVLQHGLSNRHIVLFEHTGGSSFNVRVFDFASSCEVDFNGESKTKTKRVRTQGKNAEDSSKVYVKLEEDIDEVLSPVKVEKHDHAYDKEETKRKRKSEFVNVSSTGHPQFVTSIKQYNVRRRSPYMHIPADFCVANGLYNNGRICLKGPSSKQEVSLKVCRGGRTIYAVITRGWSDFIARNDLKVGDICTFKLRSTGSSSNAVVFDVEVLRKSTSCDNPCVKTEDDEKES